MRFDHHTLRRAVKYTAPLVVLCQLFTMVFLLQRCVGNGVCCHLQVSRARSGRGPHGPPVAAAAPLGSVPAPRLQLIARRRWQSRPRRGRRGRGRPTRSPPASMPQAPAWQRRWTGLGNRVRGGLWEALHRGSGRVQGTKRVSWLGIAQAQVLVSDRCAFQSEHLIPNHLHTLHQQP